MSQSWFEQVYITEGIDRLLGYLKLQEVQLILITVGETLELKDGAFSFDNESVSDDYQVSAFPVEALVRVEMLLRTQE